jgi:hypothetical protein
MIPGNSVRWSARENIRRLEMKKSFLFIGGLLLVQIATPVHAGVMIGDDVRDQINRIVLERLTIYPLNVEEGQRILERTDAFFWSYLPRDKATFRKSTRNARVTMKLPVADATPIAAPGNTIKPIEVKEPFYVYYVMDSLKRSFRKDIISFSAKPLPEDAVQAIGEDFVLKNKLTEVTNIDTLGTTEVVTRTRGQLESEGRGTKVYILFQRAIIKRKVEGIEVLNSKQIVDVVPSSREIVGYKVMRWFPLKEDRPEVSSPVSAEEVMAQIESHFQRSKTIYRVTKVSKALYQADKSIVPVLRVLVHTETSDDEMIGEEREIIISLVKEFQFQPHDKRILRPIEPKQ